VKQDDPNDDIVTVFKDKAGEWRWHRIAANGKRVSESGEGFKNRAYAMTSAATYNEGLRILVADD
jgi:uncharacterized protein YegP (UPF0339 family)